MNAMLSPLRAALAGLLLAAATLPAAATTIDRVVSPGGIEAWLVEDHTVPAVTVSFSFDGGAAQDPDGKAGLASLLSEMLTEGPGPTTPPASRPPWPTARSSSASPRRRITMAAG